MEDREEDGKMETVNPDNCSTKFHCGREGKRQRGGRSGLA